MSARRDSDVEPAESGARPMVVDIVAPVAVDTAYSYRVPAGLALQPGDLVDAPLGTRETVGVVWAARQTAAIPARRFGSAEEFGEICAFICSEHAGYITGQNLLVDGGLYTSAF